MKDLTDNGVESPFLVVVKKQFYIVYRKQILQKFACNFTFVEAFSVLYSYYFTLNLAYPKIFGQILCFFHQILIKNEPATPKANISYSQYFNLIKNNCKLDSF